jgi:hypothetical protein
MVKKVSERDRLTDVYENGELPQNIQMILQRFTGQELSTQLQKEIDTYPADQRQALYDAALREFAAMTGLTLFTKAETSEQIEIHAVSDEHRKQMRQWANLPSEIKQSTRSEGQ